MQPVQKEQQPQTLAPVNESVSGEVSGVVHHIEHDERKLVESAQQVGGSEPVQNQQVLDHLLFEVMDAGVKEFTIGPAKEERVVLTKKISRSEWLRSWAQDFVQQVERTFQRRPDQTMPSNIPEEEKREYAEAKGQTIVEDTLFKKGGAELKNVSVGAEQYAEPVRKEVQDGSSVVGESAITHSDHKTHEQRMQEVEENKPENVAFPVQDIEAPVISVESMPPSTHPDEQQQVKPVDQIAA